MVVLLDFTCIFFKPSLFIGYSMKFECALEKNLFTSNLRRLLKLSSLSNVWWDQLNIGKISQENLNFVRYPTFDQVNYLCMGIYTFHKFFFCSLDNRLFVNKKNTLINKNDIYIYIKNFKLGSGSNRVLLFRFRITLFSF